MEFERTSMAHFKEIERLIEAGHSNRQIARALACRRTLVAEIRASRISLPALTAAKKQENKLPPGWTLSIDWMLVEKDIREGYELKRIWEEVAEGKTSYPNFFKYLKIRFSHLLIHTVTLREFNPGEYCEVDYAGDKIAWFDAKNGQIRYAHIFVGILCYSQKIFAIAHDDEKKPSWLNAHRRMLEYFQGAPRVLVPDCLKNGVIKAHIYDPDLNPDYVELAKHYGLAIVPARAGRPKDKALVENAVGIVMRYFKFIYRRRQFLSLAEVNRALSEALDRINSKKHTRFKTSRNERFLTLEREKLLTLPIEPFSMSEWKTPSLHPDCTVQVDGNFYSAPHIHRGKEVRVKLSEMRVEIFLDLERIALHERARGKIGDRIITKEHLPENSRAYLEATPQMVLSQARFSHVALHEIVDMLFKEDTCGNLRRAQGLVRKAFAVIQSHGRTVANPWIENACANMQRFNRFRVQYFEEQIQAQMKKIKLPEEDRTIVRKPGNPMVRGHGTPGKPEEKNEGAQKQESLF